MKNIWVAGDFFKDEFNIGIYRGTGPRFDVLETIERPGGAENTFANARKLVKNRDDLRCIQAGYTALQTLYRWCVDNETVLEAWRGPANYQPDFWKGWHNWYAGNWRTLKDMPWNTLVVSDYNKGFSRQSTPCHLNVDLLVLDSRYRTADAARLCAAAKSSIWRCTGDEYDTEYAKYFDWVVRTNNENSICIYGSRQETVVVKVPTIEVVDSCGAGDTFTAALACYLTDKGKVNLGTLVAAVQFATSAAQNVCRKRFTATTDITLESECTSQTQKN